MLNIRRKSGTAPLRYTVLTVGSLIMGMVGITNGYTVESGTTNTYVVKFDANETVSYTPFKLGDITITTNIGFTTDQYENILAYEVDKKNTYVMTYSYWWNETNGLMTNVGSSYYGNNNVTHKQNYVCQSDSTNYITECGLENTNAFANTNTMVSIEDIITNNFNATNYSIENYNYGRGSYGPSILCMINTNEDISYCIKIEYKTSDTIYSTKLNAVQNASYITNLNDLYTYINTNYTPEDTPIEEETNNTNNQITLGTCPTIQQLIDAYGSEYNESLCYSAKRILTETGIVITTPQSIFELFPTYDEWKEGYNTYKNYCRGTSTEICRQAFSGEQAQWSIYNKAPTDKIGLYQYCHLQLEIEDKTQTTCVLSTEAIYATGVNEAIRKESLNQQSALDIIIGSMQNLENVLPTSGSVLDALKTEGEERKIDRNFIDSIQELYNTFMTLFHYRNGVNGIIPDYITRIILVIVLFAVFKK